MHPLHLIDRIHTQPDHLPTGAQPFSITSILKNKPQSWASGWWNAATDGFLMLAWTFGVKEWNEPNGRRLAALPTVGRDRGMSFSAEHVKQNKIFTPACQTGQKEKCRPRRYCYVFFRVLSHFLGIWWKNMRFQWWCALSVIRFHTTCTVIGFLLALKTTCVGRTAGDYTTG